MPRVHLSYSTPSLCKVSQVTFNPTAASLMGSYSKLLSKTKVDASGNDYNLIFYIHPSSKADMCSVIPINCNVAIAHTLMKSLAFKPRSIQ